MDQNLQLNNEAKNAITIVYDGDCPFCTNYVTYTKLQNIFTTVTLLNAREPMGQTSDELSKLNIDLDEGMAVKLNDCWYHGADCLHILSLLSADSGLINSFNKWLFKSSQRSTAIYPTLRFFRNLTLRILNRKKLNH